MDFIANSKYISDKHLLFTEIILFLLDIYRVMGKGKYKYTYIFAIIFLLFAFLSGLNYKQWYTSNHRVKKNISLIYSFAETDKGCGNFEEMLQKELRKQGIEPEFDKFYLDCNNLTTKEEIEQTRRYLDMLNSKPVDMILSVGDQATYSLLTTHHQLLSLVPMVASNVHFPDEKLIKEYDSQKVYILRDTPDLLRNIDFMKSLSPKSSLEIIFNIDFTILGRQSFDLLTHVVDRKDVRVLGYQSAYSKEQEYKKLNEMVEYYSLLPGTSPERPKRSTLTVSLCPFRYTRGSSLLVMMDKTNSEIENKAFLLDKFDLMALPIVNSLNIPSFSCIREGFDENAKIVGGYMATDELSAKAAAELSARLMNKEKIGMPIIRDLEKEYVLDWTYFSRHGYDVSNVPKNVRIINYPFYDHYRKELLFLGLLFVAAFIWLTIILMRMRRRSQIERKNHQMLEEVHKRLTLSTDGGEISLWNIQGGVIEFDENYTRLIGMSRRKFTREDFQIYTHPDDKRLLASFYEMLHQSPGMKKQRVRFCFSGNRRDYQWYELRCRSLKDAKGEIMLAGIMQNIQTEVEREHQLILAKQMAEKAELKQSFLNNMSHEIRTPLNAIVGFTNLLVGEGGDEIDPEEKSAMLNLINHNNELLLKLINDVLEISRLDSGSMTFDIQEWEMTEIVKEIYMTFQPQIQPSLQFQLDLDTNLALPVRIDRFRFTQVISNLLNNANKFTQSGHITLGCKVDREHHEICIYVKDTGKGIDEKELMMIFDRFYKTDEFEQGSGLGLPICKIIIDKLGGRIEVSSKVGEGSCFAVILSLANNVQK